MRAGAEQAVALQGTKVKEGIPKTNDFYFPGKRFREFDEERQKRLASRIAMKMSDPKMTDEITNKWLDIWKQCDENLGSMVQKNLQEMSS